MISNQLSYVPHSSDFANVPIYPPNSPGYPSGYPPSGCDSSQGNIYVNPHPHLLHYNQYKNHKSINFIYSFI